MSLTLDERREVRAYRRVVRKERFWWFDRERAKRLLVGLAFIAGLAWVLAETYIMAGGD